MKKAYLIDFDLRVRIVTEETDPEKIVELAANKLQQQSRVSDLIENAHDPVEDIEVPYHPTEDGWIETDGSDETLQFGRKNLLGMWTFREWIDKPGEPKLSAEEKIKDWDSPNWREETINLSDYAIDQIRLVCQMYGYELSRVDGELRVATSPDTDVWDRDDSRQIISECIFETND